MAAIYFDAASFGLNAFVQESKPSHTSSDINYNYRSTHKTMEPTAGSVLPQFPCIEDFVVIAEFSEVTGPIPLLTIPSHIVHNKTFDINSFIMKIMSVDYHPNPSGHFQSCKDVQVLQSEPGLHSFTHYTMLHDLQARGWVRPICMAYITADQRKLHENFDAFRNMFLQISEVMKFNNCRWFMEEILKTLHTLKEIQGKYFLYKQKELEGLPISEEEQHAMQTVDLDQIVHQYTEYKHLIHSIEPLLDNEYNQHTIDAWKEGLIFAEVNLPHVASYLSHLRSETETCNDARLTDSCLKSVKALCPWGFAAAVWSLHSTLQCRSTSELKHQLALFACGQNSKIKVQALVESAMNNNAYLHLLFTSTQPVCGLDSNEPSMLSSGNEASSSYHSVAESMSEIPKDVEQSSDNESYLDISETLQTDESETEDELERDVCIWDINSNNKDFQNGYRLLKFFRTFDKVSCHVLYSLLIGRTVVIAGTEASGRQVARLVGTLGSLVPVAYGHHLSTLPWHCGILVPEHITTHQLIGLCVPERLSIHDMISPKDKNNITILDLESQQLFGPAYFSGQLLSSLDKVIARVTNDFGLVQYLRYVGATIEERLFVYQLTVEDHQADVPPHTLKEMRLQDCDVNIIRFFRKLKP